MLNTNRFPITAEGYSRLEEELHQLKTVDRPAIIVAIAEARAHGDLSENAEYSAAKEKQSFIETKIQDLESKISRAQIIDISAINSSTIQFGATVKLVDEETDETATYTVVSEYESDLAHGRISVTSPLAKAMLGKKTGDSIEVSTPKGTKYYEILDLSFSS
jgi:transcription elongation factor GreA